MRLLVTISAFVCFLPSAFGCGLDETRRNAEWRLPDDKNLIVKVSKPKKFSWAGDAEVRAQEVEYKMRTFVFPSPDGKGHWEFRKVKKLSANGRVFVVVGTVYMPFLREGRIVDYFGCVTDVAVYDDDGDGIFENAVMLRVIPPRPNHIPRWVKGR